MIIDPIDLKLIRHLETQGHIPVTDIISKFHISKEEILLRIKNAEDCGLIAGYGIKLFVPAVAGGKWSRGCVFIESSGEVRYENALALIEETIENITIPRGTMPDLAFIFCTQDLRDSYRLMQKMPGVRYAELYRIADYNVTLPRNLSTEEYRLIDSLFKTRLNFKRINEIIAEPVTEDDIKLSRLVLHRKNNRGVISIYPNINWSVVKNFSHLHIAVITKIRVKELKKMLSRMGFSANMAVKFKKRYTQLEFDIWGFADMQKIMQYLSDDKRISVQGMSFARCNRIHEDWIKEFIAGKI